jgi:two-component system, cell cycle sensor histidine kinase and response regulator CckA
MNPGAQGRRSRRIWHIALAVAVVFLLVRLAIDWVAVAWLQKPLWTLVGLHLLSGTALAFLLTYFALRYRATDQVEQMTRLQSLLVNQTHDSIITTDQGGFITSWNPGSEQLFGYSAEEVIGQHVAILFPLGLERHKWLDVIAPVLEKGSNSVESKCVNRAGKNVDTHIALSVLIEGKEPIGMMAHIMDITERKQAEVDQKKLQDQLRQASKMEAVGKLAGGVAHDFNNLLSIILGYSEIMLYESRHLSDSDRERLHQIRRSGRRAASLTRQLLAFSRKQVLQPVVVDLNELIYELQKMLARLIPNNIRLKMVQHPEACPVKVDPGQMEQVIVNLVVNARDAMPEGGELAIETSQCVITEADEKRDAIPAGEYVVVSVQDTGTGMDEETCAQIFEPFFTTKEEGKGTGFGLATVHGIVQQSGGQVRVTSELKKGSTFRVYLPVVASAGGVKPVGEDLDAVMPHGSETILLAEDEVGVRKIARDFLMTRGYTVLEAKDAEDALRIADHHTGKIHLLVTDLVMPGLPTRVLTETLLRQRPDLRILYTSGSDAFVRDSIGEANAFLQKPFTLHELAQRVRERLDSVLPPPKLDVGERQRSASGD